MKSLKRKLRVVTCIICIVCLGITAAISYNIASSKMSQKEEKKGRTVSREKCSGDRDMAEWICDIFRGDGGDDGGSEDGGAGKHCPISAGTFAEPE